MHSQYENFSMNDNETIDEMITRFTKITNGLSFLDDLIDNDQNVKRVIRALPQSWKVKSTTLKKLNDKEKMDFIGLIGNLKTHEMERQVREDKGPQKKKSIAFKASPTFSKDDEEFEQDDNEELSLLVKNVWRMFHKRGRFNNRKGRWQGKEEKRGNENALANCKKPGHLIVDCPNMKSKASTSKKPYKKATKATWDSESESDADDDTANVYFMTNANTINVCSEPSLDVSYLSIYELGDAFEHSLKTMIYSKWSIWK